MIFFRLSDSPFNPYVLYVTLSRRCFIYQNSSGNYCFKRSLFSVRDFLRNLFDRLPRNFRAQFEKMVMFNYGILSVSLFDGADM